METVPCGSRSWPRFVTYHINFYVSLLRFIRPKRGSPGVVNYVEAAHLGFTAQSAQVLLSSFGGGYVNAPFKWVISGAIKAGGNRH